MTVLHLIAVIWERAVTGAERLGWTALTAAALAGLAVAWSVGSPAAQLARVRSVDRDRSSEWTGPTARWRNWFRGRPGTPPWPRRLVVSAGLGVGLAVVLHDRAGLGVPEALGVGVGAAVLGTGLLGQLEPISVRRRRARLVADLPQALELMAAALDGGLPLRSSTAAVAAEFDGPVGVDLLRVLAAVDLGIADGEAWRELSDDETWRRVALDLARSAESGTMLVHTLRHHAADARAARVAQTQVRARAVGVRSVLPLMVCFMPAFLLIGVVPTVASALERALF